MSIFPSVRRFATIAAAGIGAVALALPAFANPWIVTSTDNSAGTASALFNGSAGGTSVSESGGTSSPFVRNSFSGGQSTGGATAFGNGGFDGGLAAGEFSAGGNTSSIGASGAPTAAYNFTAVGSAAGALTLGDSGAETVTGGTATSEVESNRIAIPFFGGVNVVHGSSSTVTGSSSAAFACPGAGFAITGGGSEATAISGGN